MGSDQIKQWQDARHHAFSTYEKFGYDAALSIARKRLKQPLLSGLEGELLFYHLHHKEMGLEALLDAGVKADFTGHINGAPANIDVTTNLDYKDANDYAEISQKRGKTYYVALANPRSEEIELFPLKFPYCENCSCFAHHITYLVPSIVESHSMGGICDDQRVIRYCPECGEIDEVCDFNYILRHLSADANDLQAQATGEGGHLTQHEILDLLQRDAIQNTQFFEKESNLLMSGLAENTYVVTAPDGDGYWAGEMHWRHPLAKNLDDEIEVHYGAWGI